MRDFEDILRDAAGGVNLSPDLLWAVGQVESKHQNFDAQGRPLRSPTGPMGRWQFTEDTGRRYGAIHAGGDDRLNDEVSTPAAAHLLSDLIDKHNGDTAAALRAYNGGGDPQYVNKVFAAWRGRLGSVKGGDSTMPTADTRTADAGGDLPAPADFFKRLNQTMPPPSDAPASPDLPAPADFFKRLNEAMPAPGAEPAKPPPPPPQMAGVDDMGRPIMTDAAATVEAARPAMPSSPPPSFPTIPEMRAGLAPPGDGFTPANVLPFAYRDRPDGGTDLRWDLGGTLRSLGTGALDLIEGPSTGKVTPEATMALMGLAGTRFARSPAAGTAQAIADTAELGAPRAVIAGRNRMGVDAGGAPPGAPTMAPGMASATGARPGMGGPDEPPPNSVGAMGTQGTLSGISERDALVSRYQAERNKLDERQPINATDDRVLVRGVNPTDAQALQQTAVSRQEKKLRGLNSEADQMARDLEEEHHAARVEHYKDVASSPTELDYLKQERSAEADRNTAAAFGSTRDADPALVETAERTMRDILASPRSGERDTVQTYINPILAKMRDADGNLKLDPERLYGIRQDVAEKLGKAARAKNPDLSYVERELMSIKSALDDAIESGASGYRKYLDDYTTASRKIDALEAMQTAEKSLISGGKITWNGMQRLMSNIVEARKPGAPLNQWQALSDEQMQALWNLRDDLRRAASAKELATAPGSDTAQNLAGWLKDYAASGAMRVIGGLPYVGRAVRTGQELSAARAEARVKTQQVQEMRNMLFRPPPNAMGVQPPP